MRTLKDIKLFELVKEYLCTFLVLYQKRSANTVKTSRDSINLFFEYLSNHKEISIFDITIRMFNAENISGFSYWMLNERGCINSTINLRVSRLKSFVTYLLKYCLPEEVPSLASVSDIVKFPDSSTKLPKSLTICQIKLLLSQPKNDIPLEFRDCCFMTLMYDSAGRDNEIRSLQIKDLYLDSVIPKIKVLGKGNKIRFIPITEKVVHLLEKYIANFHKKLNPNSYLFYSSRGIEGKKKLSNDSSLRILDKYSKRAKFFDEDFPHAHSHCLRHTRAQILYDAGVSILVLSDFLGHSDINITHIYAQASLKDKKAAMEKAIFEEDAIFKREDIEYLDEEKYLKSIYGL